MLLTATLLVTAPAQAEDVRLDWPLRPPPAVLRGFDAPKPNWTAGHRGVDLAGAAGQRVYAAGAATVVFAGELAGRPVVSLEHHGRFADQLRTRTRGRQGGAAGGRRYGDRRAGGRASGMSGRGVPALGRDVGSGGARRLHRPAGLAGCDADSAETAAWLIQRAASAIRRFRLRHSRTPETAIAHSSGS